MPADMGMFLCSFDQYGINKNFFKLLREMNSCDIDDTKECRLSNFILPNETHVRNQAPTVESRWKIGEVTNMLNTGQMDLPIDGEVALVPPLTVQTAYIVNVTETGERNVFPMTVPLENFSVELQHLEKHLLVISLVDATSKMDACHFAVSQLQGNKILSLIDPTLIDTAEAVATLAKYYTERVSSDKFHLFSQQGAVNTTLQQLTQVTTASIATDTYKQILSNFNLLYRNKHSLIHDVSLVGRCKVNEVVDPFRGRGPVTCEPDHVCKVTML